MKKNKRYGFQSAKKKKKKRKIVYVSLTVILGLLLVVSVVWIGMNEWNIKQSYQQIQNAMGLTADDEDQSLAPIEEIPTPHEEIVEPKPMPESAPESKPIKPETTEDFVSYVEGQELPTEPTYIKGMLIASKKYPLPSTFAPGESKDARVAFDKMAAAALLDDFRLTAFSTYRSFEYQTDLYQRYVERDGIEEADRYSARPGYSEHQTGLAFDIGEVDKQEDWATSRFGETDAGRWIAENAHKYGFIMRYPDGKEPITGYMYESWHFRYVGQEIATEIYKDKSTLEEYLGVK